MPPDDNGMSITAGGFGRRFSLYTLAAALACAMGVGHWMLQADVEFDRESSWMQIAQGCAYVAAMVLALRLARRLRRLGRSEWVIPAIAVAGMGCLAWREFEIDGLLFGIHFLSFSYLGKDEIALWKKLTFAPPTIALLSLAALWLWRRRREILRQLRPVVFRPWLIAFAIGCALVLLAQVPDRARSMERRFGIVLPGAREPGRPALRNVEEIMELGGCVLILCSFMELRRQRPSGLSAPSAPQSEVIEERQQVSAPGTAATEEYECATGYPST